MTDQLLREQAIISCSDQEQIEEYIIQNKGVIMKCLSSLPGPIQSTIRSFVKYLLLSPLKYLLTLPLTKISDVLEDFTKVEPTSCTPMPTVSSSDCAPSQIV